MVTKAAYEFRDDTIGFSARVLPNGDLFKIESDRFDFLKEELYESVQAAQRRILQCVNILYRSEIQDLPRRLEILRKKKESLQNGSVEEILSRLNSADIPF